MPERFLRNDGTLNEDKISWVYGFGRRIWCVDAHTRSSKVSDDMVHTVQGDMSQMPRYGLRWHACWRCSRSRRRWGPRM